MQLINIMIRIEIITHFLYFQLFFSFRSLAAKRKTEWTSSFKRYMPKGSRGRNELCKGLLEGGESRRSMENLEESGRIDGPS